MFDYLGYTGFLFIMMSMIIIVELFDDRTLGSSTSILVPYLGVLGFFIFYLIRLIRCFNVFKKVVKIQYTSEQAISVNCQKVLFMLKDISKFSSAIAYIILVDESGNKYTYVYPEDKEPSDLAKKGIKERYVGKRMELICYKNTNIIKKLS